MIKQAYDKPTILRHQGGLANKFGRAATRRNLERIDGVRVDDLIERFGTPLYVFSEYQMRRRYRRAYQAFSQRYDIIRKEVSMQVISRTAMFACLS